MCVVDQTCPHPQLVQLHQRLRPRPGGLSKVVQQQQRQQPFGGKRITARKIAHQCFVSITVSMLLLSTVFRQERIDLSKINLTSAANHILLKEILFRKKIFLAEYAYIYH